MDKKGRYIAILVHDALLVLFSAFGALSSTFNINFMMDMPRLTSTPFYFTFTGLSNMFVGLVALVCFIVRLARRDCLLPKGLYILKLVAAGEICITILTTACYLAPSVGSQWWRLYINGSLFNHLLTPLLAITGFVLFERNAGLDGKCSLISLIPLSLYGAFYMIRCYTNVGADGQIDLYYDIYGLTRGGPIMCVFALLGFLGAALLFSFLLFLATTRRKKSAQNA